MDDTRIVDTSFTRGSHLSKINSEHILDLCSGAFKKKMGKTIMLILFKLNSVKNYFNM